MRQLLVIVTSCLLLLAACADKGSSTPAPSSHPDLTDVDGNAYHTVTIGSQTWMAEDLRTTKFNDGTDIPLVSDSSWTVLSTPGYCWNGTDSDV